MPEILTISSRGRYLIANGTMLTFGHDPVDFVLRWNDDTATVVFEFPVDDRKQRMEPRIEKASLMRLRFFNVVGGTIMASGPWLAGTLGGWNLYIAYQISQPGVDAPKTITYSFYVVQREKDPAAEPLPGTLGDIARRG
jgi:hypothetical protein